MTKKWDDEDNPTTDSLEKRDREVREDGVVEGKAWPALVFGACGLGIGVTVLAYFF